MCLRAPLCLCVRVAVSASVCVASCSVCVSVCPCLSKCSGEVLGRVLPKKRGQGLLLGGEAVGPSSNTCSFSPLCWARLEPESGAKTTLLPIRNPRIPFRHSRNSQGCYFNASAQLRFTSLDPLKQCPRAISPCSPPLLCALRGIWDEGGGRGC